MTGIPGQVVHTMALIGSTANITTCAGVRGGRGGRVRVREEGEGEGGGGRDQKNVKERYGR